MFYRYILVTILLAFLPDHLYAQVDAQVAPDTVAESVLTPKKKNALSEPVYLKGERMIDYSPVVGAIIGNDLRMYSIGGIQTYGVFLTNRLVARAGLMYNYTWFKRVPEKYNAHVIGPVIGATYHITNKWQNNFIVSGHLRYDFFSYLADGRLVFFDDVADGKRKWHSAPAVRLSGGFIHHFSKKHSQFSKKHGVSLQFGFEKQFYQENSTPLADPIGTKTGVFDHWLGLYLIEYRYTFPRHTK